MIVETVSRLRENAKRFKLATKNQRQQLRKDQLNYIKELVRNYNADLLDGESPINIIEMIDQLDRKVAINGTL